MAESKREPYTAPMMRRIRLAADELAATACKSVKVGSFCNKAGVLTNKTIGS